MSLTTGEITRTATASLPSGASELPPNGAPKISANKAWLRALELTAPIAKNPERILSTVIEEIAKNSPDAPALLSTRESMTYRKLAERANQYTRWALAQGLRKGDSACLLMTNRPEYMAIWLGISRTGCAVALVNTNLTGGSLAHCMNVVAPRHVIVEDNLAANLGLALAGLNHSRVIWVHGESEGGFRRIDQEIEYFSGDKLYHDECPAPTIYDRALYIYTSGTTGLPKAANISHARLMQWSHWFAGLMGTGPGDRLYNCLPMYHSVGGVLATGAVLVAGGSVVIRERFSATNFWDDIIRWDCTLFQYIGELCRYLLNTGTQARETEHRIRMCCGNGLRPDIWRAFQERFRIPQILEFYAATEGNVSLFNMEGKIGSIGRTPGYLAHRFPATLVQFDVENDQPVRNDQGFCVRCGANETGEAIGRVFEDASNAGNRFEGYTNHDASAKKILRNVFEKGDAWFRTGDLMRKDEQGFFYFVDRIGDTFRWKGENVATSEVAEALCAFPGIEQANVYGVTVPGSDGKAGMAMLVARDELDLAALRAHLQNRLPEYAHPLFLRVRKELEVTTTFKYTKSTFAREGYRPSHSGRGSDTIYFNDREQGAFVRLDHELCNRLESGKVRL